MIGAIVGDIAGSRFEFNNHKSKDFELFGEGCTFTDDTVLTFAVAEWAASSGDLAHILKRYTRKYADRGYGGRFLKWAFSEDTEPYGSWGNGAAMRISAIPWMYNNRERMLHLIKESCNVTHNHPDAVKYACAVADFQWKLIHNAVSIDSARGMMEIEYGINLDETVDEIRERYEFDVSCKGTVIPAIRCVLESDSFEDAIRNAVSIGGDSDTVACIAGGMAEAAYGFVPRDIAEKALSYLPEDFATIASCFQDRYPDFRIARS